MTYINEAKKIANGGKVLVSEARDIAAAYLYILEENARLSHLITSRLGETVEVSSWGNEPDNIMVREQHPHITTPTVPYLQRPEKDINQLLRYALDVSWETSPKRATGTLRNIRYFYAIAKTINELIALAYKAGHREGSQLLVNLANGDVSLAEYEKKIGGG